MARHAGEEIISARLPAEITVALREAARTSDRSISGQIRCVLREWASQLAAPRV